MPLLLPTRVQLRAALYDFYAIFLSLNKEMAKENQPKGLIPFGFPQRAIVVPLSLHSYLREILRLQLLRAHFKENRFRQAEIASLLVR